MNNEGIDSWISIFEATTFEEAAIVKGLLESSKIPVVLDRDSLGDSYGMEESVFNEVAVKVPKELVSEAAQLVQSKQYGTPQDY
ncbi:MAG: hypothetical protein NUK65_09465 [Firmicutes bacterium]|nr:hypothetical protein [Bacillota bacterium]